MTRNATNKHLRNAYKGKNDEFYTQYQDIEKEMSAYLEYDDNVFKGKTVLLPCDDPEWSNFTKYFAQNFDRFGLKKLISTSYAVESKQYKEGYQVSLFEESAPQYDKRKTRIKGKIFTLEHDKSGDGKIDIDDLEWSYLEGDGDFRSEEIKKLRDESDIIITNPPFSLFREFVAWIVEKEKKFVIIGNMNAITYREIFSLIKQNKLWTGVRFNQRVNGKNMTFFVPDDYKLSGTEVEISKDGKKMISVAGTGWYTNLDHGRRHQPLPLMTMKDNIKFSKHKEIKGKEYMKYENFDAIDVPFTDAIPSDYEGAMGVPISFLNKYNPDQFEILGLGISNSGIETGVQPYKEEHKKYRKEIQKRGAVDGDLYMMINNEVVVPYARVLIKHNNL